MILFGFDSWAGILEPGLDSYQSRFLVANVPPPPPPHAANWYLLRMWACVCVRWMCVWGVCVCTCLCVIHTCVKAHRCWCWVYSSIDVHFIFEARSLTVSPKDLPISAPLTTSGLTDVLWCRFNVDCRVPNLDPEAWCGKCFTESCLLPPPPTPVSWWFWWALDWVLQALGKMVQFLLSPIPAMCFSSICFPSCWRCGRDTQVNSGSCGQTLGEGSQQLPQSEQGLRK